MLYLYVAVGGAFGALCRYVLGNAIVAAYGKNFPYATMTCNILGSFIMGLAIAFIVTLMPRGRELHALLVVGALGGFTTFSSFSYDAYMLIERGDLVAAAIYILGSVLLSILAFFAGMWVYKLMM